jgi:hypothetical protein
MTANQPPRVAAVWRTDHRAAAALRAIHDEQVLMWDLFWQSSRTPMDRPGPLAWTSQSERALADRQPLPFQTTLAPMDRREGTVHDH